MKLRKQIVCLVFLLIIASIVEGSLLVRRSLLRPNGMEPCYTCRAEDKPWSHTLLQFCGKLKDMMTRAVNAIASTTRIPKIN